MISLIGGNGFLGRAIAQEMKVRYRKERATGHGKEARWFFNVMDYPTHTIITPDPWGPPMAKYDIESWIAESEMVLHIAALADLNACEANPGRCFRVNVEGTMNVANLCAKHGKRLVFISTCCAYGHAGKADAQITEETLPEPTELYAWSKLAGEHYISATVKDYAVIRQGTLYGPRMRPELFNYIALRSCADGKEISVHGSGHQTRTYIHVADAARAIVDVAVSGKGGAWNVCGDVPVSVLDTIEDAELTTEKTAKVKFVEDRRGQIAHSWTSNAKLRELGWKPDFTYGTGMEDTWKWMNSGAR